MNTKKGSVQVIAIIAAVVLVVGAGLAYWFMNQTAAPIINPPEVVRPTPIVQKVPSNVIANDQDLLRASAELDTVDTTEITTGLQQNDADMSAF